MHPTAINGTFRVLLPNVMVFMVLPPNGFKQNRQFYLVGPAFGGRSLVFVKPLPPLTGIK
jgi:hypothetical protein